MPYLVFLCTGPAWRLHPVTELTSTRSPGNNLTLTLEYYFNAKALPDLSYPMNKFTKDNLLRDQIIADMVSMLADVESAQESILASLETRQRRFDILATRAFRAMATAVRYSRSPELEELVMTFKDKRAGGVTTQKENGHATGLLFVPPAPRDGPELKCWTAPEMVFTFFVAIRSTDNSDTTIDMDGPPANKRARLMAPNTFEKLCALLEVVWLGVILFYKRWLHHRACRFICLK